MAHYFIRVELKGSPSGEDYDNLHALMAEKNWSRTIVGSNAGKSVTVSLPHAMYQGTSDVGALDLAAALEKTIVAKVWANPIVLAMAVTNWGQA